VRQSDSDRRGRPASLRYSNAPFGEQLIPQDIDFVNGDFDQAAHCAVSSYVSSALLPNARGHERRGVAGADTFELRAGRASAAC
jgi:hypothetical protein